jgi:hypothetical protein
MKTRNRLGIEQRERSVGSACVRTGECERWHYTGSWSQTAVCPSEQEGEIIEPMKMGERTATVPH